MNLSAYLAERGLKPSQFAQDAGLAASTITRILRGERDPRGTTMRRISEATNGRVSVADIVAPTNIHAGGV